MQVTTLAASPTQYQPAAAPTAAASPRETTDLVSLGDNALVSFYKQYKTPIHIAGGALLGAGIAKLTGCPSELILSSAGGGALGGFFAGSPRRAVCMAGGAIIGASIAAMAGAPGPAIVSASGTGALIGWFVG